MCVCVCVLGGSALECGLYKQQVEISAGGMETSGQGFTSPSVYVYVYVCVCVCAYFSSGEKH